MMVEQLGGVLMYKNRVVFLGRCQNCLDNCYLYDTQQCNHWQQTDCLERIAKGFYDNNPNEFEKDFPNGQQTMLMNYNEVAQTVNNK